MKYTIYTLGCKVNQFETQAVEKMLRDKGFYPDADDADVVIINTCAVTAESSRKSRQAIRRLKNYHPNAVIAVCGCLSQLEPDEISSLGADIVFGSGGKERFVDAILARTAVKELDDPFKRRYFEELPAGAVSGRTRALLKIQDGCDNFCTYCIIPYTRGRVRSLPLASCIKQASGLAEEGYRELVITGIEIASYGKDLPGRPGLADAVLAIRSGAPDARIHLGSLEPTVITEKFCDTLMRAGNVCGHFHLSLQSGCDATLERMHRKYDTDTFYRKCEILRAAFPGCSLTADLICGFPGETEEEFGKTLAFIEKCAFYHVHAFPYSARPGTKAESMPDQIPKKEKERRVHLAQGVIRKMRDEYLRSCISKSLSVLFEGDDHGHADNYCRVFTEKTYQRGSVHKIRIVKAEDGILYGE